MLAHRLRFFALLQRRTTIVAIGLSVSLQLFLQQVIHFTFRSQNGLQLIALFRQFILLAADFHLFEFGKMAQFQLKDGFSLGFRNTKPRHQLWLRFIFMTNNFDYFVNIEERHQ